MTYSICLIDDDIPGAKSDMTTGEKRLNAANLKFLLKDSSVVWSEPHIKELVSKLIDGNQWLVSASTHPQLYIDSTEHDFYCPHIIIFDWDYVGEAEPEHFLQTIIEKHSSIIGIYTQVDQVDEINKIIASQFQEYSRRLIVVAKAAADSADVILKEAEERYKKDFSFRFGNELRRHASKSLEQILIKLGGLDLEDVVWLLGENEGTKRSLSVRELTDFIIEKLKNDLNEAQFGSTLPEVPTAPSRVVSQGIIKKLWAYRLYYAPKDNVVRKGDILKKAGTDEETLYFVLSSDCHLKRFWQKNMGFLTTIPLHRVELGNTSLKEKLELFASPGDLGTINVTSITNAKPFDGPVFLPVISFNGINYFDYILFPKEIISTKIALPTLANPQLKRVTPLLFEYCPEFVKLPRLSLSEPFLTTLINHILSNITDYGAPDYPPELKTSIKENFRRIL